MRTLRELEKVHKKLKQCRACPNMQGTPVHGPALQTDIMLIGQAPGPHEASRGRPYAHTSGKTLFKWLGSISGLNEDQLRSRIYIAAVARCFPGKNLKGAGDREPSFEEMSQCRPHLKAEFLALKPNLILAVGRVAIGEVLGPELFSKKTTLAEVVGRSFKVKYFGREVKVIPLPHPSGVSRWTLSEPGKSKLKEALALIQLS